jgi:hypothetical protein
MSHPARLAEILIQYPTLVDAVDAAGIGEVWCSLATRPPAVSPA